MPNEFIKVDNGTVSAQSVRATGKVALVVCTSEGDFVTVYMDKEKALCLALDLKLAFEAL